MWKAPLPTDRMLLIQRRDNNDTHSPFHMEGTVILNIPPNPSGVYATLLHIHISQTALVVGQSPGP